MRTILLSVAGALLMLVSAGCGDATSENQSAEESRGTLFLAGDNELWVVDAEAESSRRLEMPELSAGDPPHRLASIGSRLAMWGYDVTTVPLSRPSAKPQTLVEDGWIFIPGSHPDRIWVGFLDRDSPPTARPLRELREIASDGTVVSKGVKPPNGAWPYAEVDSGLIFQREKGLQVWDPDTERTIRSIPYEQVGAGGPTWGDLLASCRRRCQDVVLTDLGTGSQRRVPSPAGRSFSVYGAGSFSPDGSLLAVPVWEGRSQRGAGPSLALVSAEAGTVKLVPGSKVPPGYVFTAWSRDGTAVFITGGERFKQRDIVAYSSGEDAARRLDVEVGDFYDIATG